MLWSEGDFFITADDWGDPRYFAVRKIDDRFPDGMVVGYLVIVKGRVSETTGWAVVQKVEVNPKYRGLGLGKALYQAALHTISSRYRGLASEDLNRENQLEVPKIFKSLGGIQDEFGNWFIKKPN